MSRLGCVRSRAFGGFGGCSVVKVFDCYLYVCDVI